MKLEKYLENMLMDMCDTEVKSVMVVALREDDQVEVLKGGAREDIQLSIAMAADENNDTRMMIDKVSEVLKQMDSEDELRAQQRFLNKVTNITNSK